MKLQPTISMVSTGLAIGLGLSIYDYSNILDKYRQQVVRLEAKNDTLIMNRVILSSSWVMKHSERISESTAKHIVNEVFKYPNPLLIIALMEVESEFVQSAVSKMGALGLGQIMYNIHEKDMKSIGINNRRELFSIDKNVKATSFVLQMMLKKANKDVVKALHFYLGGRDGKYVSRIFSNYVHLSLEIENAWQMGDYDALPTL